MGSMATPDMGATPNYVTPDDRSEPGGMGMKGMKEDEPLSIFIPAKAFGDMPPKVGMSLKDFKIVDVDPETGEAEAQCSYEDHDNKMMMHDKPGWESKMDEMMPEEEE
jgi:hypothetical protein